MTAPRRNSLSSTEGLDHGPSRVSTPSNRPKSSLSSRDTNRLPTSSLSKPPKSKGVPFGFGSSSPTVGSQAFFNSVRSPTPSSKQRTSLGVSSSSDSSATSFSPSGSRIPQYNGIISQRTALAGSETDLHRSKSNRGSTSPSHVTSLENIPPDRLDTRQEHEDFDDFDAASMPRPQSQASIPASAFSSPRKSKRRSYVPVPAALNSAALSNGPATTPIANTPSSSSTHSVRSNGSANTKAGGVFFGSSDQAGARHAARVASAASGTGKVLSDLQFDLSTARGALETTKQTLRITQGACESLLRSKEELSGHVDNLRLENEGINKMLVRKERMLSEANQRADQAEQRVQEQTTVAKERDARATQLESQAEEMRHRTLHAESQYEALGGGLQAAKEGWSRQVQALRKNQEDMQRQHAQQLEEALKTHDMLRSKLDERAASEATLRQSLSDLSTMREDLRQEWSAHGLQGLSEAVKQQEVLNTESHKIAKEASDELARLKRVMREYNPDS